MDKHVETLQRWREGKAAMAESDPDLAPFMAPEIETIDAAIAALQAREGWKLVPIEPTRYMVGAGEIELAWSDRVRNIWRLMVNAAPTPEAGK